MSNDDSIIDQDISAVSNIKEYTFPLQFEFKISSFSNDFTVRNSNGKTLSYVRQKMFKLKEDVSVYSDESKKEVLYKISADRWIDFNASYAFKINNGALLGRVGRKGRKSLLKAHYEIFDNDGEQHFTISEENPWAKFWDALLSEVPLLGIFTGYMFNPRYVVKDKKDKIVARLSKEKSFFGRRFKLEQVDEIEDLDKERIILSLMMMTLLERRRG